MIDSFAQVLSLGEPRVASDSSQTFNNSAGIEFRAERLWRCARVGWATFAHGTAASGNGF
jgi:hypothetical protein